MKSGIILVLITFIVPVVLNLISKTADNDLNGSIYDFHMVPAKGLSYLGMIGAGFIVICIVVAIIFDQFNGFIVAGCAIFLILCGMLILAPVKGFWETTVKGDEIKTSRLWLIRQHAKISEIDYCKQTGGGIQVYLKGTGEKALTVDSMCTNLDLFEQRMENEGIEIQPYNGRKHG